MSEDPDQLIPAPRIDAPMKGILQYWKIFTEWKPEGTTNNI